MSTDAAPVTSATAFPYPGLRPFEQDESHLFFGRDEHVFEMFSLLEDHRFLAVVGASGSGKSSLVRAGLLPRLRDEGLINQQDGAWRFLIMRPGNSPLDALAAACHRPDSVTGTTLAQGALHGGDPGMTRVVLESGPKGLVRVLADARVPDDDNILLLVDQFEELFRFAGSDASADSASTLSRNESLQFVSLLLETARQTERPIHVVLTMRTDFIGDCDQFDGLPQAINSGQFLVPRLSWRQQELAITAPLQLPGFESEIDRSIVDHMLNAASHERDALPLVQHALLRMWLAAAGPDGQSSSDSESARPARHITESEHYRPIGGLAHALDRHATDLYESLTPEQQRIAACLFRCLGERSPKGQLTRRLTSVQEVAGVADVTPEEVIDVVEVFRQPGVHFLVTSPAGAVSAATSIDISHESLLRQWKLLQQWIEQESEAAAGYRRLIDAVNQGERVIDGIRLDRAVQWRDSVRPTPAWAKRYDRAEVTVDGRLPQCLQLIEDSLAEREARQLAAEQARLEREQAQARELELAKELAEIQTARATEQQKKAGTFRWMLVVVGFAAAGAVMLAGFTWLQWGVATAAREKAVLNESLAREQKRIAEHERKRAEHSLEDLKQKEAAPVVAIKTAAETGEIADQRRFESIIGRAQAEVERRRGEELKLNLIFTKAQLEARAKPMAPKIEERTVKVDRPITNFHVILIGDNQGNEVSLDHLLGTDDFSEPGVLIFIVDADHNVLRFAKLLAHAVREYREICKARGAVVCLGEPVTGAMKALLDSELTLPLTKCLDDVPESYKISRDAPVTVVMWKNSEIKFVRALSGRELEDESNQQAILAEFIGLLE